MAANGGVAVLDAGVVAHLDHLKEALESAWMAYATSAGFAVAAQVVGALLSRFPLAAEQARCGALHTAPMPVPVRKAPPSQQQVESVGTDNEAGSASTPGSFDGSFGRGSTDLVPERRGGGLAKVLASSRPTSAGAARWRKAALEAAAGKALDPWASRALHLLPMEHCIRHRYHGGKRHWITDDVLVKMEARPFAAGAMRECYALKKLSTFTDSMIHDWRKAANCVAKRYKKAVGHQVYLNDVMVQMDAKHLGVQYNLTGPPKQVDILQAAIIEFPDRPGSPMLAIEQLIEGDYVKYNSNSGFVLKDDLLRYTPQAFSHFTWCHTQGTKICVDIQGVGDIYTDPQLHTLDGEGYGDGNLGARGMALFFRTHCCNPLCARLSLKHFDRCPADVKAQGYTSDSSTHAVSITSRPHTVVKRTQSLQEWLRQQQRAAGPPPVAASARELLAALGNVPTSEPPVALVHLEVARVYAEVVMLPDLRPEENPDDALKGALFHLLASAQHGGVLALVLLTRMHADLEPNTTTFGHLYRAAKAQGELAPHDSVAWHAALLAAERGVGGACVSVAHGYAKCEGLANGVLDEPQPALALSWFLRALEVERELAAEREVLAAAATATGAAGGALRRDGGALEATALERGSRPLLSPSVALGGGGTILEASEEGSAAAETASGATTTAAGATMERTQSQTTDVSNAETVGVLTAKLVPERRIPSVGFKLRQRLAAEEEAAGLPFASLQRYELSAAIGRLLLEGGPGLEPDPARAAQHFSNAAEHASSAGKAKLAMSYYELAAQAESM